MLALTENAVQAVRGILSSTDQVPETGGLRVSAERTGAQVDFQITLVAWPDKDDAVVDEEGARIFLDEDAAFLLDDKVLDANVQENQVAFTIAERAEDR